MNPKVDIFKTLMKISEEHKKFILSEQDEDTKKSTPYNSLVETLKSCKDGSEYTIFNGKVELFEPQTISEWWENEMELLNNGKENDISACKYYVTIIKEQQQKKEGDYREVQISDIDKSKMSKEEIESLSDNSKIKSEKIDFNKEVQACITLSYKAQNERPKGCHKSFNILQGETTVYSNKDIPTKLDKWDSKTIKYLYTSWFTVEYKKWSKNKTGYTPRPPFDLYNQGQYFDITKQVPTSFDLNVLDNTKVKIGLQPTKGTLGKQDFINWLPLTDEEKSRLNENPITPDNKFKSGGNHICKKPNVNYVNLRSSAEVNDDTGMFDFSDNFVGWQTDEIIGEYIEEIKQKPIKFCQTGIGTLKCGKDDIDFLKKIPKGVVDSLIKIYGYPKTSIPGVENPNMVYEQDGKGKKMRSTDYLLLSQKYGLVSQALRDGKLPKEIYGYLPGRYKSLTWYKVRLNKPFGKPDTWNVRLPYSDQIVWVRSDNVEFCVSPDNQNSPRDYSTEFLKRVPVKPLLNPFNRNTKK